MTCGSDSWVSFVSINFQPCLSSTTHACKVQSNSGCWQSKKLQVRGRFFKKLYRDKRKLPRRQEADSMTATCWHSKTLCFSLLGGWWSKMHADDAMQDRYERCMNVECCTGCQTDQGLSIKGSIWRKILGKSWHFMLCQMLFGSLTLVQLRWDSCLL